MSSKAVVPPSLSANYKGTFAYDTVKSRIPIILTKVIDATYRLKVKVREDHGQEGLDDLKTVTGCFSKLRNEMETDKPVTPLQDTLPDVELWNEYLIRENKENNGDPPSWFKSAWLYVECYMYRRINEAIAMSVFLKKYDPFQVQKEQGFISSQNAILALSSFLVQTLDDLKGKDITDHKHLFEQMIEVCLWGNKCDLSISAGVENAQKLNPLDQLDAFNSFILVNNMDDIWNTLLTAKQTKADNVRLDIVLDNSGFELVTDLCLAEFLLEVGLVNTIVFHPKSMPWFVSDVTMQDFEWTIQMFLASNSIYMSKLGIQWQAWMDDRTWVVKEHIFWTLPHDYSEMKDVTPELYKELSESDLILFKGDLNYRKLVSDRQWPHTTSYETALRGFYPAPHCALRALKADVVVGLEEGQDAETERKSSDWMISSNFAVIQFCGIIESMI